jgi:hypothetical protein
MTDTKQRQYLDDVSRDIQDLIYEGLHTEATQLLMDQKGLEKMQAAMEARRIAMRMSKAFPETAPGLSPGGGIQIDIRTEVYHRMGAGDPCCRSRLRGHLLWLPGNTHGRRELELTLDRGHNKEVRTYQDFKQ